MQVKQVTFELSRTHNLGNYNNVKPTASALIHLEEGDSPEEALAVARTLCEAQIKLAILSAEGKPARASDDLPDLPF